MTRHDYALAPSTNGKPGVASRTADIVVFPMGRSAGTDIGAQLWAEIEAAHRQTRRRRAPFWIAAVAAHLLILGLFLVSLTRPDEPPADDVHVDLVAPPAPPQPTPPPPKPVAVKEAPKPKPIVTQAIPKPVIKPIRQPVAQPSVPAIPMPPPEPPPPPVVSPAAPPPPGYVSKLYAHLAEYKHYPRASLQAHIQGTVIVRFTIDRDGRVAAKSIVTGSGHADLDAEALATLDRAQPLPAPPPEMTAPRELVVPIQFSVK